MSRAPNAPSKRLGGSGIKLSRLSIADAVAFGSPFKARLVQARQIFRSFSDVKMKVKLAGGLEIAG